MSFRFFATSAILFSVLSCAVAQDAPQTRLAAARALEQSLVGAIAKAEKSVVAIARGRRSTKPKLADQRFVPLEYSTGVVVDKNGLILTNYHTLGEVAKHDFVVWMAGKAYRNAVVKAADPWTDLAILEIKASNLTPIEFGDASLLKKGRIVIALGNPYAIARDGNVSATWGIVSNLSRKVDGPLAGADGPDVVPHRSRETRYHFGGLIQTDAKLARGTSGGPLLDLQGKMVGLSTSIAMLAGFEKGTGYAVPVDEFFLRVLEKLKRGEEIEQGFLGVAPRNPYPGSRERGVVLERVELAAPAGQGGLIAEDEILRIDEHLVSNIDDLFFHIGSLPPNHVAQIQVRRASRLLTLPVRLTKKPTGASRPIVTTTTPQSWRGVQVDFATALSAQRIATIDPEGCVIVVAVQDESPAWLAGLRVGTVISHAAGERVSDPSEFHEAVGAATGPVDIRVFDRLSTRSIAVQP